VRQARSIAELRAELASAHGNRLARLIAEIDDDPRSGVADVILCARRRLAAERAERRRLRALYAFEDGLRADGVVVAAGVDEVGRGALAGPLTAAAVVLPAKPHIDSLDDSKRLTPERREQVAAQIHQVALGVHIAHVAAEDLDALGMTAALRRAMTTALQGCGLVPERVLVDGLPMRIHTAETAIVKGDSKVAAIAAASVVAKVARDALMRDMGRRFPEYGFELHKGYSTPEHLEAIDTHGLTPLHRRSFAPCGGTMRLF